MNLTIPQKYSICGIVELNFSPKRKRNNRIIKIIGNYKTNNIFSTSYCNIELVKSFL